LSEEFRFQALSDACAAFEADHPGLMAKRMNCLEEQSLSLERRSAMIVGVVWSLCEKITSLEREVGRLCEKIMSLEQKIDPLCEKIACLEGQMGRVCGVCEKLENYLKPPPKPVVLSWAVPRSFRARSEYTPHNRTAAQAFGVDPDGFWNSAGQGPQGEWIEATFDAPVQFQHVSMKMRRDTAIQQAPRAFDIRGATDGMTYTLIEKFTTHSWVLGEERVFFFKNEHKYLTYRIVVEKSDCPKCTSIAKIRFGP
jgi:hypothetical protein